MQIKNIPNMPRQRIVQKKSDHYVVQCQTCTDYSMANAMTAAAMAPNDPTAKDWAPLAGAVRGDVEEVPAPVPVALPVPAGVVALATG